MANSDIDVHVPRPRPAPDHAPPAAARKWPQKYPPDQVDLVDFRDDVRYFVDMSVPLTGFDRVELFGTGCADDYLATLIERVGPYNAYELYEWICDKHGNLPEAGRIPPATERRLHAIAAAVTTMWYLGHWAALDDDGYALIVRAHRAYEDRERVKPRNRIALPPNTSLVVGPDTYVNGLVWRLTTGHVAGAEPTGFGSWTWPPDPPPAAPYAGDGDGDSSDTRDIDTSDTRPGGDQ
jgi:hypothetical protein